MVQVGDESVVLDDGYEMKLRWIDVKGYCAGAKSVRMVCPECDMGKTLMYKLPEGEWLCCSCGRINYPSTRRIPTPLQWQQAQVQDKKREALALLAPAVWPPDKPQWTWKDILLLPRRKDVPNVRSRRATALAQRIEALDSLEHCLVNQQHSGPDHSTIALRAAKREVLAATAWAVKRHYPDPRWWP